LQCAAGGGGKLRGRSALPIIGAGEDMAQDTSQDGAIRFKCVCDQELRIEPELLGRVFECPYCKRHLRVGLQFLLVDERLAPNLAAICTCGRFIVEEADRAGKRVKCKMCGQQMILPKPVEREGSPPVVRVPPSVLRKQVARVRGEKPAGASAPAEAGGQISRLQKAGHSGRISLRPGQEVCKNPKCSIPLPLGALVCARCGVNLKTGVRYEGLGPEHEPMGRWKRV
jgi:DNA-directed RNA polymerase subunit RPC12/RpoP